VDDAQFPEHGLYGRVKLAFEWIPNGTRSLLDAGCSYGYATRFFAQKAQYVAGIDPNRELVEIAKRRYPKIDFRVSAMERTPFADASFDAVVMSDVLEHVAGERQTLDEVYRILAPGGRLIITVPHKGVFSFLDIDNIAIAIKRHAPALYRQLFYLKERRFPEQRPGYEDWHRHYSYADLQRLLASSRFSAGFTVERVRHCGLVMDVVISSAYQAARAFVGFRRANAVLAALNPLYSADYAIDYGPASYNIALCVQKNGSRA
jgi:SAM-dependent methyltransferase